VKPQSRHQATHDESRVTELTEHVTQFHEPVGEQPIGAPLDRNDCPFHQ
jgi:hypothetical protein